MCFDGKSLKSHARFRQHKYKRESITRTAFEVVLWWWTLIKYTTAFESYFIYNFSSIFCVILKQNPQFLLTFIIRKRLQNGEYKEYSNGIYLFDVFHRKFYSFNIFFHFFDSISNILLYSFHFLWRSINHFEHQNTELSIWQ